ncbi:MAG: hypothetical protein JXQ83_03085 [Candidatus Glassbacteria bacterium]|nr:hypothetical protein [Candidatus Glassbacteria bacterium]
MPKKRIITLCLPAVLAAFLLFAASCSEDKSSTEPEGSSIVELSLSGLEPLEGGLNYQAWVIEYYNGYLYGYPLVIFNLNEAGAMIDVSGDSLLSGEFTIDLAAEDIYGIVVSIELSDVVVTSSSYTQILGGEVSDGEAALTTDSWLGMDFSFENLAGRYVLATPTDSISSNEKSGIWFMDLSTGVSLNGLVLPDLSAGWEYEGWVILDSTYISTGKFTSALSADDMNQYSGAWSNPSFPGEDFLQNAPAGVSFPTDLAGASVLITIEPEGSYDVDLDKPFPLRLLVANIPSDATPHTTYYMNAVNDTRPGGTATIKQQ